MNTILEIESAVSNLPKEDISSFRKWFIEFDQNSWDEEIKADMNSGKLADLINGAKKDYQSGNFKKL